MKTKLGITQGSLGEGQGATPGKGHIPDRDGMQKDIGLGMDHAHTAMGGGDDSGGGHGGQHGKEISSS